MPSRRIVETISLKIERLKKVEGCYMEAIKKLIEEVDFIEHDNVKYYMSQNLKERVQIEFTKRRLINNEYEIYKSDLF